MISFAKPSITSVAQLPLITLDSKEMCVIPIRRFPLRLLRPVLPTRLQQSRQNLRPASTMGWMPHFTTVPSHARVSPSVEISITVSFLMPNKLVVRKGRIAPWWLKNLKITTTNQLVVVNSLKMRRLRIQHLVC